jgi:hypothetical protein
VNHPYGRRYYCRARKARTGATPNPCAGRGYSHRALELDAAAWADVRAWLENEENVRVLLTEWEQDSRDAEHSLGSRLDASAAQIAYLRGKMSSLAESISETTNKESKRMLQEKLDDYGDQVTAEERKREKLMEEAHDQVEHARAAQEMHAWVRTVAERAPTFTREEQRTCLKALGARMTVWNSGHVHPDGWPQHYRVTLHWADATGQPVVLPAHREPNYL